MEIEAIKAIIAEGKIRCGSNEKPKEHSEQLAEVIRWVDRTETFKNLKGTDKTQCLMVCAACAGRLTKVISFRVGCVECQ